MDSKNREKTSDMQQMRAFIAVEPQPGFTVVSPNSETSKDPNANSSRDLVSKREKGGGRRENQNQNFAAIAAKKRGKLSRRRQAPPWIPPMVRPPKALPRSVTIINS